MDSRFRELGYPEIKPVATTAKRPRWSVMIPTYNCASLLRETLASVLAEGVSAADMQIEVVDDCSTKDRPEDVVAEMGQGRVTFHRHSANVGAIPNFNACIERATGELVHILHGDDLILPGFYQAMGNVFAAHPTIGSAYCQHIYINAKGIWTSVGTCLAEESGILNDILPRVVERNVTQFAAVVIRRDLYGEVGGFHPQLVHTADWDMWKRTAMVRPVGYVPRALACYRVFDGNDTSRLKLTGEDKRDMRRAIDLAERYLPDSLDSRATRMARYHHGSHGLADAERYLNSGRPDAAIAQLLAAIELYPKNRWKPQAIALRLRANLELLRKQA